MLKILLAPVYILMAFIALCLKGLLNIVIYLLEE